MNPISNQKQLSSYITLFLKKKGTYLLFSWNLLAINFLPLGVPSRNSCIPGQVPDNFRFQMYGRDTIDPGLGRFHFSDSSYNLSKENYQWSD